MMASTEAWDSLAAIFLVNPDIFNSCFSRASTNGSNEGPKAIASSLYRWQVFEATVVRKLAS